MSQSLNVNNYMKSVKNNVRLFRIQQSITFAPLPLCFVFSKGSTVIVQIAVSEYRSFVSEHGAQKSDDSNL
jgi:hypothetical protein